MKRFIIAILVSLPILLNAQIPINSNWNVGVDFGTTYSTMTTKHLKSHGGVWGLTGGITGSYTFNFNLVTELGVRLTDKGTKRLTDFDPNLSSYLSTLKVDRLTYLEFPLMVGYQFKLSKLVSITPKVGGYLATGISGKGEIESADGNFGMRVDPFKDNHFQLGNGEKYTFLPFNKFDGGLLVGANVNVWRSEERRVGKEC